VICEKYIEKDVKEGISCGLFYDFILVFTCRNWDKPQKASG